MDDKVRVSVCIPTYNHAALLGDTLRSALRQDVAALEILVLDNASTDDTERLVRSVGAGDPRVRYVRHAENIGMARNFSACVSMARGEYVLILCADDVLEPGCAAALAAALDEHPEAVLAACGRVIADDALRPLKVLRPASKRTVAEPCALVRKYFVYGNTLGEPSAVMFRRAAGARGFDASYSQLVDLEMWFHLLAQGSAVLLPEALCTIRRHAGQVTQQNLRAGRVVEDKRRLFREFAPGLVSTLSALEKWIWDGRMALGIVRAERAGSPVDARAITEVFFQHAFAPLTRPLVLVALALGAGRGQDFALRKNS